MNHGVNGYPQFSQTPLSKVGLSFPARAGPAGEHQGDESDSCEPPDDLPRFGEFDAQQQPNEQGREADQKKPRSRLDRGDRDRHRFMSPIWGSGLGWTTLFKLVPELPEIKAYLTRFQARPAFSSARAKDAELAAKLS